MKKVIALGLILMVFVGGTVTAWAQEEAYPRLDITELAGKTLVSVNGPSEIEKGLMENIFSLIPGLEMVSMPSFSQVLAALIGGRGDGVMLPMNAARFVQTQNPELVIKRFEALFDEEMRFFMIARSQDKELILKLNEAIRLFWTDGTLDRLYEQHIAHFEEATAQRPSGTQFEQTLYVGVSGDVPPIDYIGADGVPAGFNVGYMEALGEKLNMNVALVVIPYDAQYQALMSGKIDVFFFYTQVYELPESIAKTEAYMADVPCMLLR